MSEAIVSAGVAEAEKALMGASSGGGEVRAAYTGVVSRKTTNEDYKQAAKDAGCAVRDQVVVFQTSISGVRVYDPKLVFSLLAPIVSVFVQVDSQGKPIEGTGLSAEDIEYLEDEVKAEYRRREFATLLVYPQHPESIIKAAVSVFETGSRGLGAAGLFKNTSDWLAKSSGLPGPHGLSSLAIQSVGTARLEKQTFTTKKGEITVDTYTGSSTVSFLTKKDQIERVEKLIGTRELLVAQFVAATKSIQYKIKRLCDGPKEIGSEETAE